MKYIIHPDDWKELVKEAAEEGSPVSPIPPRGAVEVIVSTYAIKGKPFPMPDPPTFYYREPPRLDHEEKPVVRIRTIGGW